MSASPEGPHLDYEAISPPIERITELFNAYLVASGSRALAEAVPGIYGVLAVPPQPPTALVSIDFCEVLRGTGAACSVAMERPYAEHPYWLASGFPEEIDNAALVRALMKANKVPPIVGAEEIVAILQELRARGVLVIGNTSTLPSCEEPTLRFITEHYPGAFDGINFNTGGHFVTDGNRTKAWAALTMLQHAWPEFSLANPNFRVCSVDDRPHHNIRFHEVFAGCDVRTYAPLCVGEEPIDHGASIVAATPLAAFMALQSEMIEALTRQAPR